MRAIFNYSIGIGSVIIISIVGCSTFTQADSSQTYIPCLTDSDRYQTRSTELQFIKKEDQDDRVNFEKKTSREILDMGARDVVRRKRIGEIFGEGCFKSANDFSAAALVYQHGDIPDHFMQAFIWSKRAIELGDPKQKSLMALALDRYLVNTGRSQLFGSQATKTDMSSVGCWCLQTTEPSFPDSLRVEYTKRSIGESIAWVQSMNQGKDCPKAECPQRLKPTPKGSIPGFW